MEILGMVEEILDYGPLCDNCLGRFFGKRSFGLSNRERGRALRIAYALKKDIPYEEECEPCWICNDLLKNTDLWAKRVEDALSPYEFDTFLIGTRMPPLISESEEMVWSDLSLLSPEPIKAEVNREVGKKVSEMSGWKFDPEKPDVVAIIDLSGDMVEVQLNPLFFRGRYLKYVRGIPQTHWDCRKCRGEGCEECNFTGKQYPESVEELIGMAVIKAFDAENVILHGSGREDIDARMLGTGRPFVMEALNPKKRRYDLDKLEEDINSIGDGKVAVRDLSWCTRRDVERVKSNKAYKKYRILVDIDTLSAVNDLESAISNLKGREINQRTPVRVSHRRADRVRKRRVLDISLIGEEEGRYLIEVLGDAGLYIKELISGDNGRTNPSLAGLLDTRADVVTLDVIEVIEDETGISVPENPK